MKTFFLLLVVLGFTVGCGGEKKPDGFPPLYPVKLTFVQEGKPLTEATVSLVSDEGSQWSSGGTTDENGVLLPRTYGKFVGVPAGTWKVMVYKRKTYGAPDTDPQRDHLDYDQWMLENASKLANAKTYNLVDLIYNNKDTTPLTITVEKQALEQTLDVGKAVKIEIKRKSPI